MIIKTLSASLVAAILAASLQTYRLQAMRLDVQTEKREAAEALAKQKSDAAKEIAGLRANYERIQDAVESLPNGDKCGLDDDWLRHLNQIQ